MSKTARAGPGKLPRMASIRKEIAIDARPEDAWAALRDWGALHERLARGFVVDTRLDGEDRIGRRCWWSRSASRTRSRT
jgi:hypothetical protein